MIEYHLERCVLCKKSCSLIFSFSIYLRKKMLMKTFINLKDNRLATSMINDIYKLPNDKVVVKI